MTQPFQINRPLCGLLAVSLLKKAATLTARSTLQGQRLSQLIFEQRGRTALISLVKMSPFLIAVLQMVAAIGARLW